MVTKRFKYTISIYLLLLGLVAARLHIPFMDNPGHFYYEVNFVVSTLIVEGILFHWATTISKRVMHKDIKRYMITVVGLQIAWLTFRNMKWSAFEFGKDVGRWLWYMFYISMLLIPLYLLFIALSVSKDETYRLNKKCNLLFIPTISLILLVLTNDMHQLVFQFHPNFENWDTQYAYGAWYPVVVLFMVVPIIMAMITLFRKWRKINKTKGICLMLFVSGIAIAYFGTYIVNRPLASRFIDITVFGCMITILFLESCIEIGLIRSNNRHQEIFEKADITAQILDQDGKLQYYSVGDTDVSEIDFITLKENKKLIKDANTISNLATIHGGYVTWNSDITNINKTIKEIETANKCLYDEVELLKRANKQKEERVRTERQSAIQDIIFTEIQPIIEQIKCRILQSEHDLPEVKKRCLYEISIISAYIKRKTNLMLMAQIHRSISVEEMAPCFYESFQNLEFCNSVCYLHVVQNHRMDMGIAMLTYDLFQEVLEKASYCPKEVFITYDVTENRTNFSIRISAKQCENMMDIIHFEKEKLLEKGLCATVEKEADGYYIAVASNM